MYVGVPPERVSRRTELTITGALKEAMIEGV